jgi:mono/diheme cytochrome c family protein
MNCHVLMKNAAVSLFILAAAGCGGGGGGSSSVGGPDVVPGGTEFPAISWYSAAQPLFQRYCVSCHTEGGTAPFPLETYEQVYGKRSAMAFVLESDTMPPLGYTDLNSSESNLLLQWLADGAPMGDASQAPYKSIDAGFTYHGNARAIIEKRCLTCHVDGGVAPFPLDSYEKVKAVAAAAAFSIDNGTMPPWPPTKGYSRFKHERGLSAEEEFVLTNWLAGSLAEGNPQDYVPPVIEEVPNDLVYNLKTKLPEPYTPIERPDDHRCFAIDWPLDEFAFVRSVNVIPDQLAEVHHVIVNIIEPQYVPLYRAASGKDGRPGWECSLSGGLPGTPIPRQIGGWVPGATPGAMPEGTGLGIPPGSLIVVQMHYNTLVAEPTPDQTAVEIATTDTVERPASGFLFTDPRFLSPGGMPIQAGDPDARHHFDIPASLLAIYAGAPASVKPSENWALHTGFLHMHTLAKTGRVTLIRPNGTEHVIIDVRDWDFDWQSTYALEREVLVNPSDRLRLECSWDNSASNQAIINGVQQAPKYVEWGENTGDEMCLTSFYMTKPKAGYDYSYEASVHIEAPTYRQRFAPGDLVPLKLVFNNFSLHEPGEHGEEHEHQEDSAHDGSDGHEEHAEGDDEHGGDHSAVYEGHYHVYLNTDDDSAEHATAWDSSFFYQLPEDLPPGRHTLRVSLRGTDHHALDIEESVEIEVGDESAADAEALTDVNEWEMLSAAEDRFSAHRPAEVVCPDNSWYNEDGALEVQTGYCNYLALAQPSKVGLKKGDTLHLVLWHGNLRFDAPAQAHASITVDGRTVWQKEVEIPSEADIFDVEIPVDFDAPVGSQVEYHLHNHGYNTWILLKLDVER